MKKVGIIGGSGFIGSYNTKKFLEEGYSVRVSATDISKTEKYEHLKQLPNAENMEIVPLDVTNEEQLKSFMDGCQIVVHGGTPFQLSISDPQSELFDPTIKGTENFLHVVQSIPGIEKVVFIASVAAFNTNFPLLPDGKSEGDVITEEDTRFMSEQGHPYAQAKFLANQVVQKFVSEKPDPGFEITTVSPVGVMGLALSKREDSTSMGLQYLVKNNIAPDEFFQMIYDNNLPFGLVDVEDVAEGVYQAATRTGLHGKDYLLSCESYHTSDMHLLLNNKPAENEPFIVYSGALSERELGIKYKPTKQSLNRYAVATS